MFQPPCTLVTIGPSHFCEKARWALERLGIAYEEERHAPLLHLRATLRRRGRTTPILVSEWGTFRDSTEILRMLDVRAPEALRLFPSDPAIEAEVAALEERFDRELGPHVRRWCYAYLLEDAELTRALVEPGLAPIEQKLFRAGQTYISKAMRRAMRIDAAGRDRSLARIRDVFAEVDARLADGRSHLVGGRFSAADLTLASLAAPLLLVPGYGAALPSLEQVPAEMRAEISRLRDTPTGRLVFRLYRDERKRVLGVPVPTADPASPEARVS